MAKTAQQDDRSKAERGRDENAKRLGYRALGPLDPGSVTINGKRVDLAQPRLSWTMISNEAHKHLGPLQMKRLNTNKLSISYRRSPQSVWVKLVFGHSLRVSDGMEITVS